MDKSATKKGWYGGLILLQCLLWGVGNPVIKISLEGLSVFYSLALRFCLAFLLFSVFFGRSTVRALNRHNIGWCLLIAVFNAAAFFVSTIGLTMTSATTAGFLMSVSAIFTPFLSVWLLKKPLDVRVLPVVAVVLGGMYLLCTGGGSFVFGLGEALCFSASLSFAFTLVLSQKHMHDIGPLALSTVQVGVAAVLAVVLVLVFEDVGLASVLAGMTPRTWVAVLYMAVGSTFAAYLMQNAALRHVSAVFASLAFCSEPVFTAIASYILLGESLSGVGYLGGALILVGLVLSSWLERRPARGRRHE